MIKNIVKGKHIFSRKAKPATEADKQVVTDLIDTLRANREICVLCLITGIVFAAITGCHSQSQYYG